MSVHLRHFATGGGHDDAALHHVGRVRAQVEGRARFSLSKSVQVIFGSHVDVAVDQRRCGEDRAVQLVFGQYVQLSTGIQHDHHALFGCNVDFIIGVIRTRPAWAKKERDMLAPSGQRKAMSLGVPETGLEPALG